MSLSNVLLLTPKRSAASLIGMRLLVLPAGSPSMSLCGLPPPSFARDRAYLNPHGEELAASVLEFLK